MSPTVFIIDDDADQVALVTAQIERGRRFATKGFTRPESAIEEIRADPPDAVVCDLVMPGMDGIAFVRRVREIDGSLPIIIATARGTEGDAERALEAGATDFVTKPIEPRALETRIRRALEQAPEDDWVQRLACWIRASVQAYRDTLDMHDLVFSDHMRSNYQGERNTVTEPLHSILSEGQKAGAWAVADVDLTAWVIYQGMHGAVDNMGLETAEQWAAMEDNLVTLFVSMLGATPPCRKK